MAFQVLSVMFLARDMAHKEHLKTGSFAQHSALGSFYVDVIGLADSLAEAYQGKYGIIKEIPSMSMKGNKNISQRLKMCVDMIEKAREEYDPFLQNIVDEAIALFYSTIYKLDNLK
jgi:hypothetical protein